MSTLKVEKIQHPNSASVALTLDTSGYLALQAGSASTPAIQGPSDPNTGIFFPAADTIAFAEGGTEVLRIDSNGRVGLGTSSVSAGVKFQVADGTASKAQFNVTGYGGLVLGQNADLSSEIDQTSSGANFFIKHGGTAAITIDTSRRVGVGTTSPSRLLHLSAADSTSFSSADFDQTYNFLRIVNTTNDKATGIYFGIGTNGEAAITAAETSDGETALVFGTRGGGARSERARLDSSGRLLVGTTSAFGVNSNTAPVLAGNFASFTGSVSANHSTATTLFTLENLNATYIVTAVVTGTANATAYHAVYIIGSIVTNSHSIQALKAGSLLTLSLNGANVQATQGSGIAQTITWSVTRMANL